MNHAYMYAAMIAAGLLSTMNVWVDKIEDIRWSLNDVYMTVLMTGWMALFMGLYNRDIKMIFIGSVVTIAMLVCIRTQVGIDQGQYINGMIPHHSMAVHMSKKVLEQNITPGLRVLANKIILSQNVEIGILKKINHEKNM